MRTLLLFLFLSPAFAQTIVCQYAMSDATGSTLPDTSGNANHGTLVNSPTITSLGVTFARGANQGLDKRADLPAGCNTWLSAIIFGDPSNITAADYWAWFGSSASGATALLGAREKDLVLNPSVFLNGTDWRSLAGQSVGNIGSVGLVRTNGSNDKIFIDGTEVSNYISTQYSTYSATQASMQIGANTQVSTVRGFAGPIYYAVFYSTTLTAGQMASERVRIRDDILIPRGVSFTYSNTRTPNTLVCAGDSLNMGIISGIGLCSNSNMIPNGFTNLVTGGYSGTFAAQWVVGLGDSTYFRKNFSAPRNIVALLLGTNDISAGLNITTTYNNIVSIHNAYRAAGFKTLAVTIPSRASISYADEQTFNNLIRAGYTGFADGLVDIGANAFLGCNGCYADATYFGDGIHPKLAGENIEAGLYTAAINAIYNVAATKFMISQ